MCCSHLVMLARVELVTDERAEHQRCRFYLVERQGNYGQELLGYISFYDRITRNFTRHLPSA